MRQLNALAELVLVRVDRGKNNNSELRSEKGDEIWLQLVPEQPITDHASENFELRLATLSHLALLAVFCLNAAHVPLRVQVVVMNLKKRPHLIDVHLALSEGIKLQQKQTTCADGP